MNALTLGASLTCTAQSWLRDSRYLRRWMTCRESGIAVRTHGRLADSQTSEEECLV